MKALSSPTSSRHSCRNTCCISIVCLFAMILLVHNIAMTFQRTRLRCNVVIVSHLLALRELCGGYWWDNGTLLGLIREGDIIFTETDADISAMLNTQMDIVQQWTLWRAAGFVHLEKRDELKLRLYDEWGMHVDMEIWQQIKSAQTNETRMQMLTGVLPPITYNVPSEWILPTQQRPLPAAIMWSARSQLREFQRRHARERPRRVDEATIDDNDEVITYKQEALDGIQLSVPAQPESLLEHWYGPNWRIPIKYDKGRAASTDYIERLMWRNFIWLYQLFWTAKIIVFVSMAASQYHRLLLLWYFVLVFGSIILFYRILIPCRQTCLRLKQARVSSHFVDNSVYSLYMLAAINLTLHLSVVSKCSLFTLYLTALIAFGVTLDDFPIQGEVGWGMWRLLLPTVGVPLFIFAWFHSYLDAKLTTQNQYSRLSLGVTHGV